MSVIAYSETEGWHGWKLCQNEGEAIAVFNNQNSTKDIILTEKDVLLMAKAIRLQRNAVK